MSSFGNTRRSWRTTVSPPTPESNTPMGNSALGGGLFTWSQSADNFLVSQHPIHDGLRGHAAEGRIIDPLAIRWMGHERRFNQHGRHLRVAQDPEPRPF